MGLVTIIGRENVGKSTLFNRLIGEREAVTSYTPGVTRDINIKPLNLDGKIILLADTGGLILHGISGIKEKVKEKIIKFLEKTDLVIFMTDVKDGITGGDEEIAEFLRKYGKKVILAVNKVDNDSRLKRAYEFQKFGFDIYPISALHGRGISSLLRRIEKEVEGAPVAEAKIKIAIIGRPNVGKSTYINKIIGEDRLIVDEKPGTTVDSIDITFEYKGRLIQLVDTPGLRRRSRVDSAVEYFSSLRSESAIERCNVAIQLLDCTEHLTRQDKRLINLVLEKGKGLILAVNKIDLEEVKFHPNQLDFAYFVPLFYISALKGERIYEPLDKAIELYKKARRTYPNDDLKEIVQSLRLKKVKKMVQIGIEPLTFKVKVTEDLKENERKYIERAIRERFELWGLPIRLVKWE